MEVVFALLGPHMDDKPLQCNATTDSPIADGATVKGAQISISTSSGIRTSGRFHRQLQ
ncbi:hypothetical protein T11_14214 [Trichinella zimbabwensis]|uniref:Uncharacterized protein n=1 Tax=Trichinella zimbabwensis TaxID=268475 RepID=A0A0V1HCG7_9BILA|nr:hypothetical protein T11_14214 [Trichinella zimbabwensis]